jgi:hypothetical protein
MLLWHGSRRWDGAPEVRRGHKGRMEHGPGLYMTTRLETAWRYAKGGGRLYLFELDDDLHWITGTKIPLAHMLDFLGTLRRIPKRDQVYGDLRKQEGRFEDDLVPSSILVNVLVNADALGGDNGPDLANFLIQHDIDGDCVKQSGEDWVVLWNMRKVVGYQSRSRTEIPVELYDLPKVCP